MRRLATVASAVLLLAALAPSAAAAPPQTFHLQKVCPDLVTLVTCDITQADGPFAALVGGQVLYDDHALKQPNAHGFWFEDATIELVTANNVVMLVGHVHWRTTVADPTVPDFTRLSSNYAFQGVSALAGLHAVGAMTKIVWNDLGQMVCDIEGTYHTGP